MKINNLFQLFGTYIKNWRLKKAFSLVVLIVVIIILIIFFILPTMKNNIMNNISGITYPGCNTPDIIVGSYIISACNVGTNIAGIGESSYGGLYQWGNNYNSRGGQFTNGNVYPTISTNQVIKISNYSIYSSNTFIKGFIDWTLLDSNGSLRSVSWNSCATGYHIPTHEEWIGIHREGGWGKKGIVMSIALKLPIAGRRDWIDSNLRDQGTTGYYWSSSSNDIYGYGIHLNSSYIDPNFNDYRTSGFSIRCFKN